MSHDSTRKRRRRKAVARPKKPYPDFPLSPHASGAWQKKIRGKIHYFGRWAKRVDGQLVRIEGDGWQEALELYKEQAEDLHAGRTPRVKSDGLTVAGLCNAFLTAKLRKQTAGELSHRMFAEYKETTDLVVAAFGKDRRVDDLAADDFEALRATMAERWGPVRLGNAITRVKSVFKYGIANALIEKAIRYGSEFKKPDKAGLRRHRAKKGEKMLEADQLRNLIDAADVFLKAMILLGVNCGYGNADCAKLPLSAVDLDNGWIDFPRPKSGVARRCPLWPETLTALRNAIAERPEPRQAGASGLVFLTSRGRSCVSGGLANAVGTPFANLMKRLELHREGLGFYVLRHTFRTVADAARDPVAIDLIMGHSDPSMGGYYRERIEDDRLRAVVAYVHDWLIGDPSDNAPKARPDVTDSSDQPEEVESGSQDGEPASPANSRPTLRLYVGSADARKLVKALRAAELPPG
jgi:integrase